VLDYAEYTTGGDGYQGNGRGHQSKGYDQLDGDWALYYEVARGFTHRVKPDDREDFLHDLFLAFARVKASYLSKGKELSTGGLVRIAQYELADYWHNRFKHLNGTDCRHCSKEQRARCKREDLYSQCPKVVRMESLDRMIEDGDGDKTELYQMIADQDAVDIIAIVEARQRLKGYPRRAVQLAYKRYAGYRLDSSELSYLSRFRKSVQQRLFA
jgi:hypothetical protein